MPRRTHETVPALLRRQQIFRADIQIHKLLGHMTGQPPNNLVGHRVYHHVLDEPREIQLQVALYPSL